MTSASRKPPTLRSRLSAAAALSPFTDIDTNAVIDVSSAVTTAAVWSGGDIDADLKAALEAGFSISDVEAPGSVNWTYSVTDAFDFLDAGETITLTYTVTITDNNNASRYRHRSSHDRHQRCPGDLRGH